MAKKKKSKKKDDVYICPHGGYDGCNACRWSERFDDSLPDSRCVTLPDGGSVGTTGDYDIDDFLRDCLDTMRKKGEEYTVGSFDRLANFRAVADDVGISMERAWFVFFNKHIRAIANYVKTGKTVSTESIHSRIKDAVVYLLLFEKMVLEREAEVSPDPEPIV